MKAICEAADAVCACLAAMAGDACIGSSARTQMVADGNVFRRRGKIWEIWYQKQPSTPGNLIGLKYIWVLLAHPGRLFPALELVQLAAAPPAEFRRTDSGSAAQSRLTTCSRRRGKELFDREGLKKIYDRLREYDEQIEHARRDNDVSKLDGLRAEKEKLCQYLSKGSTPGGKPRRLGDDDEKARKSVQAAINRAIAKIGEDHSILADHLLKNIDTGRLCTYKSSGSMDWTT